MVRARIKADAPVTQHGEDEGTDKEVGHSDDGVRQYVCPGSVETVHPLTDEYLALFEEGGNTCDGHEGEEGDGVKVDG